MTCKSKKVRIIGKVRHPIMGWSNISEGSSESDHFVTKIIDKCENQRCHDPKFERVRCNVEEGEKIPKNIFEAHRDLQKKGSKEKCWSKEWCEATGRQLSKHSFLGMPTSSFENCSGSDDTWHTMIKTYTDVSSHRHLSCTDQAQQKEKRCKEFEPKETTGVKMFVTQNQLPSSGKEASKLLQKEKALRVVFEAESESSGSEEEHYEARKMRKDKVKKYPSRERNQRLVDVEVFKQKKFGKGRGRSKERQSSKEKLLGMFEVEEESSGPEQIWYYLARKRSGDEMEKSPSRKQSVRLKTHKQRKPKMSPRERSRSIRQPSQEKPKKIYKVEEESSGYEDEWYYEDEKQGVDKEQKFQSSDKPKKSLSNEMIMKSLPSFQDFVSSVKVKTSLSNEDTTKSSSNEKIKHFEQDEDQTPFVGKDESSVLVELKPSKVAQQDQAWKIMSQRFKQHFSAFEESSSTTDSEEPAADINRTDLQKKESEVKLVKEVKPQKKQFRKRPARFQKKYSAHKIDETDMRWRIEAMFNLLSSKDDREYLDDIEILVGGKRFRTCRLLLVITSRFFRQQMREGNLEADTEVNLCVNVTSDSFATILNWMNTGEIDLTLNNIGDILYLANQLGIDSLVEKCEGMLEVLREQEGDAVCLYEYATERNMKQVASEAAELAEASFLKVVRSERFLNYTFQQVTLLLSLDEICVNSELEIFYAVWKWVSHSWDYRKRYKDSLIHYVEFENMTLDEIFILATSLIDEAWNEDNPLTWGGDGYVVDGLIRGLLKLCGEKRGDRVHHVYRKQKCGRQEAAIKIQRFYRAKKKEQIDRDYELAEEQRSRRIAQYKKKRVHKQEAARRIQRAYRGYQVKKVVKHRNAAAVTIQRYYRGYAMRKRLREAERAATVIQRAYRRSKDHERHWKLMSSVSRRLQRKREASPRRRSNVKTSGSRRGGKSLGNSTIIKIIRK